MKLNCRISSLTRAAVMTCLLGTVLVLTAADQVAAPERPHPETQSSILAHHPPRLVVVMVFDQLRYDYLLRYADLFLPATLEDGRIGGFRWFMEKGAFFADAHYSHVPT